MISAVSLKSCTGSQIKQKSCSIPFSLALYNQGIWGKNRKRQRGILSLGLSIRYHCWHVSEQPLQKPVMQVAFRKFLFCKAVSALDSRSVWASLRIPSLSSMGGLCAALCSNIYGLLQCKNCTDRLISSSEKKWEEQKPHHPFWSLCVRLVTGISFIMKCKSSYPRTRRWSGCSCVSAEAETGLETLRSVYPGKGACHWDISLWRVTAAPQG